MDRKFIKKALWGTSVTLLLLVVILGIHIYVVTRPQVNNKTVALARIDIKQSISETQAGAIESWLSQQAGVSHVVLNRQTDIIVFSFYPVKANASQIAQNLRSTFNIAAARYMPTVEQIQSGCPALAHTFSGKAYTFFSQIFNHN